MYTRKKISNNVVASLFIILTIASMISLYIPKPTSAGDEIIVIPNEAIRLRILANSNSKLDQEIKREIRDRVNEQITEWVSSLTSLDEARDVITNNLDEIYNIANAVLKAKESDHALDVDFGKVHFPTKLYGNFLYPAGEYEAILITVGEGVGANWWCVLFPPLCFLDFSSGSAVSEGFEDDGNEAVATNAETQSDSSTNNNPVYVEDDEVVVKFFIFELFDKIIAWFK